MATLTEALDRENQRLEQLDGVDFMLHLRRYADFLERERGLRSVLDGITRESEQTVTEYVGALNNVLDEAKTLRVTLAERAPEVDDSGMREPEHQDHEYWRYEFSLANFDRCADRDTQIRPFPVLPSDAVGDGGVWDCINILRGKVRVARWGDGDYLEGDRADRRPELEDVDLALGNLTEREGQLKRQFAVASRTLPGFALARLTGFSRVAVREAEVIDAQEPLAFRANRLFNMWWSPQYIVQKRIEGRQMERYEADWFEKIVRELKEQADLLHHDLVQRLTARERERESQWRWKLVGVVSDGVREASVGGVKYLIVGGFGVVAGFLLHNVP